MRIGHGYDVHQLVPGRPLILGGVKVEHHLGLLGHSDADVALHALMDAVLGALGEGDIGQHFPDSDPRYKGADSRQLLRDVSTKMRQAGYCIGNLDLTILAQKPKLAPYIAQMKSCIAADLQCAENTINIKATTTEELGFVGREEGMACHAVVLLDDDHR